ncbi:DUF7878 domain-containing protein [Oerskovia turbata]
MSVEMFYDLLSTDELRGTTQADYLIVLDACLLLRVGGVVVFEEPGFPVVELARSLRAWLADSTECDFEFQSMSCEETGAIRIWRTEAGWVFGSVFVAGALTAPTDRSGVEGCCRRFVAKVELDLEELGIDPAEVLRR